MVIHFWQTHTWSTERALGCAEGLSNMLWIGVSSLVLMRYQCSRVCGFPLPSGSGCCCHWWWRRWQLSFDPLVIRYQSCHKSGYFYICTGRSLSQKCLVIFRCCLYFQPHPSLWLGLWFPLWVLVSGVIGPGTLDAHQYIVNKSWLVCTNRHSVFRFTEIILKAELSTSTLMGGRLLASNSLFEFPT